MTTFSRTCSTSASAALRRKMNIVHFSSSPLTGRFSYHNNRYVGFNTLLKIFWDLICSKKINNRLTCHFLLHVESCICMCKTLNHLCLTGIITSSNLFNFIDSGTMTFRGILYKCGDIETILFGEWHSTNNPTLYIPPHPL